MRWGGQLLGPGQLVNQGLVQGQVEELGLQLLMFLLQLWPLFITYMGS